MLHRKIQHIEKYIKNPKNGLPEDLFLFASRIVPMINVDLLIKDKKKGVLLTWRKKGEKTRAAWHLPGGIIRFQEKIYDRIKKVAAIELNSKIIFKKKSIALNELHLKQKNRSNFISLLYLCKLKNKLDEKNKSRDKKKGLPGQWMWFKKAPSNIIKHHKMYIKFINSNKIIL